jgi:dolichol kinase
LAHALTADSQRAALELHQILLELDPSRWRADLAQSMRPRIEVLRGHLTELARMAVHDAIRERMRELSQQLEQSMPSSDAQQRWQDFRLKISPAYERLAASLNDLDIHVPSLRPTNYARNAFHICNALLCLGLLRWVLDVDSTIAVTVSVASAAWSMELSRRWVPKINELLMWVLGPFAHPHEAWRINSATWYTTALVILSLVQDLAIASTAVIILGFADPAAAIIGRRWGKTKLVNGRSLQGSSAFVAVGTAVATSWLILAYGFSPSLALTWGLSGALFGALAELFSRRIDDNLSIPVGVAIGLLLTQLLLGL